MADGVILYKGPSLLDGAPIVVIATGFKRASDNVKTGGMIQTYILRSGVSPTVAIKTGDDASICGDCLHRGAGDGSGRTCYVNVGQGPLAVWRAFRAGKYPHVDDVEFCGSWLTLFRGRKVRLGTYGDPAAAPTRLWALVTGHGMVGPGASGWTGYTHQWRTRPDLQPYCMASVDTIADTREAQLAGWRTFRVALPNAAARILNEVICPASAEAGKKLTCSACMACSGGNRRGSIVIQAHGGFAVMANIKRRVAA
mgnify:CR=1 FL=1